MTDMVCVELVEVVTDYLEGAMAREDVRRFESHLEECPFCTDYVEQMRAVAAALGGLREETIAPERRDALVEAFRGWRER
jgi:predicted anti-sigma-YlaC factor YlaD